MKDENVKLLILQNADLKRREEVVTRGNGTLLWRVYFDRAEDEGGVEEILFFSLICQVAWWRLIYSGDYSGGLRSLNQF